MQTVILSSGGLDSFLCWALAPEREKAINVFVNINQKYERKEAWAIRELQAIKGFQAKTVHGADLSSFETPSGIIPNRNAHLILAAAQFGESILIGVLRDEINSDKSPDFMHAMETVLNISNLGQYWNNGSGRTFAVNTPLIGMTKSEAVGLYLSLGNDPAWLQYTVSCYSAEKGHCGRCASCFKRWVALVNNELPYSFVDNPLDWAREQGIITKCCDGTYGKARAKEIIRAVTMAEGEKL